jgi:hypothetical protein
VHEITPEKMVGNAPQRINAAAVNARKKYDAGRCVDLK